MSGSNSVVECQLPKLDVAGSIPVSRSSLMFQLQNPSSKNQPGRPEPGDNCRILHGHGPSWSGLRSAGFDPEALWQRVDGDMELLRQLLAVFEQEFSAMLAGVERAIAEGDAPGLEKAGHKIKGSLLQFSAHHAAAAAQQLEILGRQGTVDGAAGALETLKRATRLLLKSLHVMTGEAADSGRRESTV
jgi:HPt (histidine-containing phosphotransfer) domain-containing protein